MSLVAVHDAIPTENHDTCSDSQELLARFELCKYTNDDEKKKNGSTLTEYQHLVSMPPHLPRLWVSSTTRDTAFDFLIKIPSIKVKLCKLRPVAYEGISIKSQVPLG